MIRAMTYLDSRLYFVTGLQTGRLKQESSRCISRKSVWLPDCVIKNLTLLQERSGPCPQLWEVISKPLECHA